MIDNEEIYNYAYDRAYNFDDTPVGDAARHRAGIAAVANQDSAASWNAGYSIGFDDAVEQHKALTSALFGDVDKNSIEELVHVAIGAASMAWNPRPDGAFDVDMALRIAEALVKQLKGLK